MTPHVEKLPPMLYNALFLQKYNSPVIFFTLDYDRGVIFGRRTMTGELQFGGVNILRYNVDLLSLQGAVGLQYRHQTLPLRRRR